MFHDEAILVGRALYPHTYARATSYDDALSRLVEYAESAAARKPAFCRWVLDTLQKPCGPAHVLWAARWAGCGFPQITLGHKLAASLCATRMPAAAASAVEPPWSAYLIRVPSDLVIVPDKLAGSGVMSIDYLTVFHAGSFVHITARSRSSEYTLSVGHRTLASGLLGNDDDDDDDDGAAARPAVPEANRVDDAHDRALQMLWRLMIGVDVEMSQPDQVVRPRAGRTGASPAAANERAIPVSPTYKLSRDVVVDCRAAIGGFLSGDRSTPSVQFLVRGHWKTQSHGRGYSARRWIHIEPYWRGPEEAPVAVRQHRLMSG